MIEMQDTPSHCVQENRTEDNRGSWKEEEEEVRFRIDSLVFFYSRILRRILREERQGNVGGEMQVPRMEGNQRSLDVWNGLPEAHYFNN